MKTQVVKDTDGTMCEIMERTSNSVLVFIRKKTDKGIDCTQWFTDVDFKKRFKA